MHLIKDENGNVIPHGGEGHHHDHDHGHEHCHACGDGCEKNCTDEVVALLNYMLSHNQHHAEELDQMAENLTKLGMEDAAKNAKEGDKRPPPKMNVKWSVRRNKFSKRFHLRR